ncbi:Uncharacterized membrane protein YeaQ/YmgE, transglycosylase-associated protein family [Jatrophihabitans endophyticus]|uniref:Uncharacterized membrane protein YeaQ/YmgE, transglycosylase-associated protein family n=1 Tax=Jatrophihabitans endophyticus TaxID=1206085 RepID=A0A1M5HN21_9ACTN|nr:GlsB/YeaQ/YmgE family stress response membrane protein [Jatrophihabitans endophyticus]SHG17325.1 Uncharacterized membrane protein YeaQ/YmgE, transglycosylase-associated protein family [Jatrophihabitans endophyticus]
MFVIGFIIVGLIAGAIARLLVPGRDPMGIIGTIVLGMVGSLVGGFLGYLIFHKDGDDGMFQVSGIVGSVLGSILVLLVWRKVGGRRQVHA